MNQQDKEAKAIEKLYDNILKAHKLPEIIDIDRLRGNFYGLCKSSTYGLVNGDSNEMRKMLFDYFLPHLRETKTDALKAKDKESDAVDFGNWLNDNSLPSNVWYYVEPNSERLRLSTTELYELFKQSKR